MKLIFALGNPEPRYSDTRHNIGFFVVDQYTDTAWHEKTKFKALITELSVSGEKVIIAKPTTYYNLVGESLQAIMSFYDLQPEDVLIIHDDLALPFGTIRTRAGGSDAGNNGIKSINTHGGQQTSRLRVGIANQLLERIDAADFVLSKYSADEHDTLQTLQPKIAAIINEFVAGRFVADTHK